MLRLLIHWKLWLCALTCYGQGYWVHGVQNTALSGATVSVNNYEAVLNNPANVLGSGKWTASANHSMPFLQTNLATNEVLFQLSKNQWGVGVAFSNRRLKDYSSSKLTMAGALRLHERLRLGLSVNYHGLVLAKYYGRDQLFSAGLGLSYLASDKWTLSSCIYNYSNRELTPFSNDFLSSGLRSGCKYSPSDKIDFLIEVEHQLNVRPQYKLGLRYQAADQFTLLGGINLSTRCPSFGLSYHWKKISLCSAFGYHFILGFTPSLSLTYEKE